MRTPHGLTLLASAALLAACGGTSSGGGGPTCTPGTTTTVTIAAGGVSPKAVCVLPSTLPSNGIVIFRNNDTVAHSVAHSGATCPELDVGPIAPNGGTLDSAPLTTVEVCQFHDVAAPANAAFQGTVAVTTGMVGGPGY